MEVITKVTLDAEEADDEQVPAKAQSDGARHVTILMAVGFPTDEISPTLEDGATVAQAVAVDGVLMVEVENEDPDSGDYQDPGSGDTTEVSVTAEAAAAANILPDVTGEVDFGWGIVVGSLSFEDLMQIASFPELLATD